MEGLVYVLCALAAIGCALLLGRGYRRSGFRLLLWSALCFLALALENALLFVDLIVVPHIDLSLVRMSASLLGIGMLLYGLVWEVR
jgi:hypothetical protein